MLAIIDADIVAFRCAATAEDVDNERIAIARTNDLVELILGLTNADSYKLYLSGSNNFRKQIYPLYKANRVKPPPRHLQACRDFLESKWGAEVVHNMEADDAIGIEATKSKGLICSIDKDLLQIPGTHFNWVRKEFTEISEFEAIYNFWRQVLIGDSSDNIKGCPGIGPKKAAMILKDCKSDLEMFRKVRKTYSDDELMFLNAQLLWILKEQNQHWNPNKYLEQELDQQFESMPLTQDQSTQSTEHGGMT